jgi:hypothetical protein
MADSPALIWIQSNVVLCFGGDAGLENNENHVLSG